MRLLASVVLKGGERRVVACRRNVVSGPLGRRTRFVYRESSSRSHIFAVLHLVALVSGMFSSSFQFCVVALRVYRVGRTRSVAGVKGRRGPPYRFSELVHGRDVRRLIRMLL